jgi:hypothetical protein
VVRVTGRGDHLDGPHDAVDLTTSRRVAVGVHAHLHDIEAFPANPYPSTDEVIDE